MKMQWRDYSLTGADAAAAPLFDRWYECPVPRKRLKQLMRRSDGPTLVNYAIWIGLLLLSGIAAYASWGTWWAVPAFLVYGVLYGSCADSRWHECAHGTCFKTRWINEIFYHLASFMALKEPYLWRWSHARHHSETVVVGRDPEIAFPRPPDLIGMVANLLNLKTGFKEIAKVVQHAGGRFSAAEETFVPDSERSKVVWTARVWLLLFSGVVLWSVLAQSWLPVMLIGLPTFYGSWLHHIMAATQHAGLAEDVPDHRLSSRNDVSQPGPALCLFEHELPHRAPYVPNGAISCPAGPSRGDEGRSSAQL